jgi:hypothetical protein
VDPGPAAHRKSAAQHPGHESAVSKDIQFINPSETILGDQWANRCPWECP